MSKPPTASRLWPARWPPFSVRSTRIPTAWTCSTCRLPFQRALRSLDALVLEGHLRTHVAEMMANGEVDRAVQELLRLYRVPDKT